MSSPLRILIADDHEVVRNGFRHMLRLRPEWEICAEAANGREAVALVEQASARRRGARYEHAGAEWPGGDAPNQAPLSRHGDGDL